MLLAEEFQGGKSMDKEKVIDILDYNMAMLTCDMSISRDPEHQDVPPDYYGKDAEDLYYACEYCIDYFKKAIPIEWIEKWIKTEPLGVDSLIAPEYTIAAMLYWWEKENDTD